VQTPLIEEAGLGGKKMKGKKDAYRVARMIRELENKEICHDYYDVFYEGVEIVLRWYGICESLTDEEQKLLEEYLLKIAFEDELCEIVHLTEELSDPILSSIPDRPAPSLRLLKLQHKLRKNEMLKKRTSI